MKFDDVFDAYMETIYEADEFVDLEDDEDEEGADDKKKAPAKKETAECKLADVKKFIKTASKKDLETLLSEIEKAQEEDEDDDDEDDDDEDEDEDEDKD